mmetsp:Transcript_99264/g.315088  ORF Transcript_99264/g.315088 Transcript_99264/m.315088 type:complete len:163 (+) Transcript_99264:255-743(+)
MDDFKGSPTALVADVDCTAGGKDLCEKHGIQGFPTIKWGDPDALETYEGGRDYNSLKKFAKENIKPICSPANLDLCDEEKKKVISDLQQLSPEDLSSQIEAKQKEIKDAESELDAEVKALQERYQKMQKAKEEKVAAVKASGLGLMLSVQAHAKKAKEKVEL